MNNSRPNQHTDEKVVITGIGLVTPVGLDSIMAPSSIWAGITRFYEIPDFVTPKGAGSVGSIVKGITDERSGTDRLLSMAVPAAQEALFMAEEFYEDLDIPKSKLFLSMNPQERPVFEEFEEEDIQTFLDLIQAEGISSIEIIREGNSGGVLALLKSMALLKRGEMKTCIIGGIDSLVEYPSLAWLEEKGRLKTDDRPDGLIPGEAAGFLVLELASTAEKRGAPILGEILGGAYTKEDADIFSDKPLLAKGLSESIRNTLEGAQMESNNLNGIICDLNGENYRFKEWGIVQSRVFDGSSPVPDLWHPAEYIGDIGAASFVVYIAIGVAGIKNKFFSGSNLLMWTSSDTGGRGSCLLTSYAKT